MELHFCCWQAADWHVWKEAVVIHFDVCPLLLHRVTKDSEPLCVGLFALWRHLGFSSHLLFVYLNTMYCMSDSECVSNASELSVLQAIWMSQRPCLQWGSMRTWWIKEYKTLEKHAQNIHFSVFLQLFCK